MGRSGGILALIGGVVGLAASFFRWLSHRKKPRSQKALKIGEKTEEQVNHALLEIYEEKYEDLEKRLDRLAYDLDSLRGLRSKRNSSKG